MIKKITWPIILLCLTPFLSRAQSNTDSIKQARAAFIKSQTVKADSLNIAALKLAVPDAVNADLNKAIDNIMSGLHIYSKFRDSTGLRETFDHLGLVYHLQKKYTQAKWFILQSNSLSRDRRDTLNIITSLISLAAVKEDIKDFSLAKRDLTEALLLAKTQHIINQQIDVLHAEAKLYTKNGDAKGAAMTLNRINYLKDSVIKTVAKQKTVLTNDTGITADTEKYAITPVVNEKSAQYRGVVITAITLITAGLAVICLLFYRRSKKRNK